MDPALERLRADYDAAPYGSLVHPASSPDQLAAVAHLFGVQAPRVDTARVLEIGCASGANLLDFAHTYPTASVVGIDISGVQIAAARRSAAIKGLTNASLVEADIATVDLNPLGQFDFVIAHGVYSWVPERVQAAILSTIRNVLTPDGVAYVSYNIYPGWKSKEVLRDFLVRFEEPDCTPSERIRQARDRIDFLGAVAPAGSELERIVDTYQSTGAQFGDAYLLHEELELFNAPCYFVDFVQRLATCDLIYLADSQIETMFAANVSAENAQRLIDGCRNQLELEQVLDFVGNRAFRQSLVVHAHRADEIRYDISPQRYRRLHFAATLAPTDGPSRFDHSRQHYAQSGGEPGTQQIFTNDHGIKAALDVLTAHWPYTVSWAVLTDAVRKRLSGADLAIPIDLQDRIDVLLHTLIVRGLVRYRLATVAPGDDPIAPSMFTR